MPYILKSKRTEVEENPMLCREPGDVTYVFSKYFYKEWLKSPRWTTYHKFRKLLKSPEQDNGFEKLFIQLINSIYFTKLDIQVAAELALDEFFWRVVRKYEDGKKIANGDVFKEEIPI